MRKLLLLTPAPVGDDEDEATDEEAPAPDPAPVGDDEDEATDEEAPAPDPRPRWRR